MARQTIALYHVKNTNSALQLRERERVEWITNTASREGGVTKVSSVNSQHGEGEGARGEEEY